MKAATRQMAARGAEATSLQSIADEVGIRKPSILYHFPTKDALRVSVLEELLTRWSEVLPRLFMATTRDGVARFDAVMGELVGFFAEDPDRARLLMREQMDRPAELREYLVEHVRPWMDVVADYITKGQKSGQIRGDVDPQAYVLNIVHATIAIMATASDTHVVVPSNSQTGPSRCARELVRMCRAGLFQEQKAQDE